jgi:hypothetical protein
MVEVEVKERSSTGSTLHGSKEVDVIDDEIGESVARERE